MMKCPQENILLHGSVSEMRCAACEQRVNCEILPAKKQLRDNIKNYLARVAQEEEAQKNMTTSNRGGGATHILLCSLWSESRRFSNGSVKEWHELERHILGLENLAQEARRQFPKSHLHERRLHLCQLYKALEELDKIRQPLPPQQKVEKALADSLTDAQMFEQLEEWAEHKSDFRISTEYAHGLTYIYDALWPRFRNFDKAFRLLVRCCDMEYKYERDHTKNWSLVQVAAISKGP